jgi:RimJ/RimL family protein N-acetyltransferase
MRRRCLVTWGSTKWRASSRRRRPRLKGSSDSSVGVIGIAQPGSSPALPSCPRQPRALERPAPPDRGDPIFQTGEWGFALGSAYWGSGLFLDSARQVLDFAFDHLGVRRLEARAAVVNGRGNGALRKTGAVQEGVLRRSFHRGGQFHDQVLWSILAEDWRLQRGPQTGRVH